jgi:RNA polymerase sigma factor (sigma-70 family)
MMKVFQNIASYRPEKGKFFNWVYTIVRNTALDKFRMSATEFQHQDIYEFAYSVADPQNENNPMLALEEKDIYVLLDSLNPATRVVCNLFYVEGLQIKEIAEQLRISGGTVKWHLSESRKKLRSVFEKHLND